MKNPKKITRKKAIPKRLKQIVWEHWIGADIGKHKCMCCKKADILQGNFECEHVVSKKDGGDMSVDNLKPICGQCNRSMGIQNMNDYVKKCNF